MNPLIMYSVHVDISRMVGVLTKTQPKIFMKIDLEYTSINGGEAWRQLAIIINCLRHRQCRRRAV